MENRDLAQAGSSTDEACAIDQLPALDVFAAFASQDSFDEAIADAHECGPFAKSSRGLEVLGHKQCVALLRDKRLDNDHMALVERMGFPEGPAKDFKREMLLSHGRDDYRNRIRLALTKAIGRPVIEKQREAIRQITKDLLKKLNAQEDVDLLNEFAFQLPASLFCHWVGAPRKDAAWVARISDQVLQIFSNDPKHTPGIIAAYDELFPYVEKFVEAAKVDPGENLLGDLVAEYHAGNLSNQDLYHLATMLNEASTDNTAHGIATAIGNILGDKQRWQQLVENPELIPEAVIENMRLSGRINTLVRIASEDFEFEGVHISKGTAVHFLVPAAHRDPKAYENPTSYLLARKMPSNLLDFGGGIYMCIGMYVAMMEVQEALFELATHYPDTEISEFKIDTNVFVNQVVSLRGNVT